MREALKIALEDYKSNCIRLPVVSRYWLHGAFKEENGQMVQTTTKEQYRALVDELINTITKNGKYVILDLHSFYAPQQSDIEFWESAAVWYKDHPNVIFGVFNEPVCDWRTYYEGGHVSFDGVNDWGQEEKVEIDSPGVPALVKAIRGTGAKNLLCVSGIDWGFDLTYITEGALREFAGYLADDLELSSAEKTAWVNNYMSKYYMGNPGGNGIMFETHPYPSKPDDWDTYLFDTLMEYPVLVGECGPTETENGYVRELSENDRYYLDKLTAYMDKYEMHLTAWSLGAWPHMGKFPSLEPSGYGEYMLEYIPSALSNLSVTLYEQADYTGKSVSLNPGRYTAADLKQMGFDLYKLASVARRENYYQYTVELFEKEDFTGKSVQVVPSVKTMNATMSGFTPKSLKITRMLANNLLPGMGRVTVTGAVNGTTGEELVDGNMSTMWESTLTDGSVITIELDDYYALTGIALAHAEASGSGMMSVDNASAYTISVSQNNKLYTRVVDVTGNNMGLTTYTFEQAVAKYIRIHIRKGGTLEPEKIFLAEVMAYGAKYAGDPQKLPNPIIHTVSSGTGAVETPDTEPEPTDTTETEPSATTVTKAPTTTVGGQGKAGLPAWAIVLIAVGAVVVVGGGAAAILVLRKKKAA